MGGQPGRGDEDGATPFVGLLDIGVGLGRCPVGRQDPRLVGDLEPVEDGEGLADDWQVALGTHQDGDEGRGHTVFLYLAGE